MTLLTESPEPFDLLIVDSTLGDAGTLGSEGGEELIRETQTLPESLRPKIIFLAPLGDRRMGDSFPDVGHVPKPVYSSMLFDSIMDAFFERGGIPASEPVAAVDEQAAPPLHSRIHFLVAEDNRVNQIVVQNILIEAGHTCDIVSNGHEAVEAIRKGGYDAILMDCQMPEMDGYDATISIRDWEQEFGQKRIPIIALTANATKEDVQKCLDVGMDAYCSKPVNQAALFRTIDRLLLEGDSSYT
jgi:CheY-like chemotaxis protein